MFDQLDVVVRSLLDDALPDDTEIRFDAPQAAWAGGGRIVNAFLHEVREDKQARLGGFIERRDADGRLVARESPPRHYRARYLVTAWSDDTATEHLLLGASLAALGARDTVVPARLPEPLGLSGFPVLVSIADPELPRLGADIWSALNLAPRCCLDLVLTTALVPAMLTELAPAPRRIALGVTKDVPGPPDTAPAAEPPMPTVTERF